ncbi:MAG: hypothetical protein HUJ75_01835 [Parasporobacterium sp.]|nr:hypothetical protein [Parasporobacterium sp.]
MKKIIILLAGAVLLASLAGCTGDNIKPEKNDNHETASGTSDITLESLQGKWINKDNDSYFILKGDKMEAYFIGEKEEFKVELRGDQYYYLYNPEDSNGAFGLISSLDIIENGQKLKGSIVVTDIDGHTVIFEKAD